jgi:hypothetical protein
MISEKALRVAAKEVNEVLDVDPPINTKAPVSELIEKMKEAKTLIDPTQDEFTEATQAVLDELEEEKPAAPVRKAKPAAKAVEAEEAPEDAPEGEAEAPVKKVKKGAPKKAGEPGKPGIIATIVSLVEGSGKKGITKAEILKQLVDQFPERSEDSMKNTINVQVPARINKEKFPVKKLEGDRYCKA